MRSPRRGAPDTSGRTLARNCHIREINRGRLSGSSSIGQTHFVPAGEECCANLAETFSLEITSLTNGPDALARHGGRVVFVPGAAPGDRLRARLVTEHKTYARAQVTHHCVPGPAYREPPCPWAAECGGCPWQQVRYPAQLAAKTQNVRDALARIACVGAQRELTIVAAPREWGYRHRIRLHVGAGGRLGYKRPRSHEIVEVGACQVADPALSAAIAPLRGALQRFATRLDSVELLTNGRGGVVAFAVTRDLWRTQDADPIASLMRDGPEFAGVRLHGTGWELSWGDVRVVFSPDPAQTPITLHPGSFTQVNADANQLLVRAVVAWAAGATRVLDLFCGAGNLSLPLARAGASVVGVDRDRGAIADAAASAAAAGITDIRFEVSTADRFLRQQGVAGADLVVLDPPRAGAPSVATQLGRLRPRRILYVSCDPATMARDVRTLAAAGYAVDRVQPIDLFPQTEHVETLLEAARW